MAEISVDDPSQYEADPIAPLPPNSFGMSIPADATPPPYEEPCGTCLNCGAALYQSMDCCGSCSFPFPNPEKDIVNFIVVANGAKGIDGKQGHNGADGASGLSSSACGNDGCPGQDGQNGLPGLNAGTVMLTMKTDSSGAIYLDGRTNLSCQDANLRPLVINPNLVGNIVVSVRGGDGGRGGNGGKGGHGGYGAKGRNASRMHSGGNGGNGGNGGRGGSAGNGGAGGTAGRIDIIVSSSDSYLLTAVSGLDNPSHLIAGGKGGPPGVHGAGGMPGDGGSGGSSYSWTTSSGSGKHRTTRHHTSRGGFSGHCGYPGPDGSGTLYDGPDQPPGILNISCDNMNYNSRFDLKHVEVMINNIAMNGIAEYGDCMSADFIKIKNTGGMPTPPRQRIRFTILPTRYVLPVDSEELYHPVDASIPANAFVQVNGTLHWCNGFPDRVSSFNYNPIIVHCTMTLCADQLGYEHSDKSGRNTQFQKRYSQFANPQSLILQYPVENNDGLQALLSLSAGESTACSFTVSNPSTKSLGSRSPRGRRVALLIEQASAGDISSSDICIKAGDSLRVYDLPTQHDDESAHYDVSTNLPQHEFELIPETSSVHWTGTITIAPTVQLYCATTIRFKLLIQEVSLKSKEWTIAQHRASEIRIEPAFSPLPDHDVFLVCSMSTTRRQYMAWCNLLEKSFGMKVCTYSVTRCMHLNPSLSAGFCESPIGDIMQRKPVIVLNQPFDDKDAIAPSMLIPSRYLSSPVNTPSPSFLFVGSEKPLPGAMRVIQSNQTFMPRFALPLSTSSRVTGTDYKSQQDYMKALDANTAIVSTPLAPTVGGYSTTFNEPDLACRYDSISIIVSVGCCGNAMDPRKTKNRLLAVAEQIAGELRAQFPSRRFAILAKDSPPKVVQKSCCASLVNVGSLIVLEMLSPFSNLSNACYVMTDNVAALQEVNVIEGPYMRYTMALSLPIEQRLKSLNFSLVNNDTMTSQCIVATIVRDIWLEGYILLSASTPVSALPTLSAVVSFLESQPKGVLTAGLDSACIEIVSCLQALCDGHGTRIWFSRSRSICSIILDGIDRILEAVAGITPSMITNRKKEIAADVDALVKMNGRFGCCSVIPSAKDGLIYWKSFGNRFSANEVERHLCNSNSSKNDISVFRDIEDGFVLPLHYGKLKKSYENIILPYQSYGFLVEDERYRVSISEELLKDNITKHSTFGIASNTRA